MAPIPTTIQETAQTISSRASTYLSTIARNLFSPSTSSESPSEALRKRQDIIVVPKTYAIPANNPSPGTVAGIVLGVVGGICFVLWIMYIVFNLDNSQVEEVEIIKTKPSRRRREPRDEEEIIEVSRTRVRAEPRRTRETTIIEERRSSRVEDDIVEVIEEHSPPRRSRRSSGYRNVDPNEFAGGRRDRRGVR